MNRFVIGFLCLLFSFNVFAGFGEWWRPIRNLLKTDTQTQVRRYSDDVIEELLENRKVFEDPSDLSDMTDDVRDVLRTWSNVNIPENARPRKVFRIFREVFDGTNRNTSLYRTYETLIFDYWWGIKEFRSPMLDSITRENLYKMEYLLKWYEEARAWGRKDRLGDFISSAFSSHGPPWMDNAFLGAVVKAARSSENFARELEELEELRSVMRDDSHIIEDVAIPPPAVTDRTGVDASVGNSQ